MQIFGHSFNTLEQALNLRMDNQRLIVSNVANMDTPGYTAQRLDFRASMDNALKGVKDAAVIEPSAQPATSLDGNNVDLDQEMAQLSENKVLYSVQSQLMGAKFRQLTTLLDSDK